jgi:predicted amidohydrolase YtcJ
VPAPDLILIDADIRTIDPFHPRATALAVRNGRIMALGDTHAIRDMAGPGTSILSVGGRLVLPGFQDTHIHLQDGGIELSSSANLEDCVTPDELVMALRTFAAAQSDTWINGCSWHSGLFGEHNLDHRLLDAAVSDRPCFIVSSDGHSACINEAGMAAIGLDAHTPDPTNGSIVRARDGRPTGMLHEAAVFWAYNRMPQPTDADYVAGVRFGQALCNRHGITGVLDAAVEERHVRVYEAMARDDALTVRLCATAKVIATERTADAVARVQELRRRASGERFRVHSAKFFLDGILENRTAAMLEPYSDSRGGNAPLMFEPDQIRDLFSAFDAARFQIHVHAIGDAAVRAALDGIAAARSHNSPWPSLHQIAHVQSIHPADLERFAALDVMANIQPLWARMESSISDVAMPMLGPDRSRLIYAFRSLIDAGAACALSSDWSVSTLNPFKIIETAITRQPPKGPDQPSPFLPEQRLTIDEAVRGYTLNAAAAAWRSSETGSLAIGKAADLIVLDRDIFAVEPSAIGDTTVLLTLLAGREVYRDPAFDR